MTIKQKSEAWKQVKALGNLRGLTWRTPYDKMQEYLNDALAERLAQEEAMAEDQLLVR